MSADNYDLNNMKKNIREKVQEFQKLFPDFQVISGYRSPSYNEGINGAKGSRHMHGDAFDFVPKGNVADERKADAINWLRSQGATGLGTYSRAGSSFHADWKPGGNRAWGPNRSYTSLGQTPDWFQGIAGEHRGGRPAPTQFATVPPASIPNVSTQKAATAPASGAFDTKRAIYDKLRSLGVGPNTAAGAIGSLTGESGTRLDPNAINPNDNKRSRLHPDSIGLAQWNDTRALALRRTAQAMGTNWNDPRAQVEHLGNELQGSHKHVLAALLKASDSVENGANIWTTKYEVAAPATAHQDRRIANGYALAKEFGSGGGAPATPQVPSDTAFASLPARPAGALPISTPGQAQPEQGLFPGMKPGLVQKIAAAINPVATARGQDYPPTTGSTEPKGWPYRSAWDIIKEGFTPGSTPIPQPNAQGFKVTTPGASDSPMPSIFGYVPGAFDRFQQRPPAPTTAPEPLGPLPPVQMPEPVKAPAPLQDLQPVPVPPKTPEQTPAENPLIVRGIRPTHQDTMTVPLPPQRPSNDQLFPQPQPPALPPRPQGTLPFQPQPYRGGPFWADSFAPRPDGTLGRIEGGGLLGALGLIPTTIY